MFSRLLKPVASVLSATACAALLIGCNQTTQSEAVKVEHTKVKPNILFILADDHRWDLIGKYHPIIKTPNIDTLANQGFVFKNAFVTTPICATSRVSILTGLTERTHDFTFQQPSTGVAESAATYPAVLKRAGYRSAFIGKYEIKLSGNDSDRFDYFKPLLQSKTEQYKGKELPQTYYIAELANDFIQQSQGTNQPWVMAVNFWNPHAHDFDPENQYHYPAEFESWYQDVTIPPAKLSDDETFNQLPEFLRTSMARKRWYDRFGDEATYQKMVKRHYRAISSVDKAVGMIYQALEKVGQADNTIIIYNGDNGYSMNERQLAGKWFGWEEDLRVPLIVYDPRNKQGTSQEISQMALNIDIPATILDLAGVEAPETYQGASLLPLIEGKETEWRNDFFFEHMYQPKRAPIPPTVGVRTEKWKYVDFYKNDHQQLYDLENDPEEKVNLAKSPEHQAILKELEARTQGYIKQYEQERSDEVKARGQYPNQESSK